MDCCEPGFQGSLSSIMPSLMARREPARNLGTLMQYAVSSPYIPA